MNSFLENFGFFAIFFSIVYGYKKIQDYYYLKRLGLHENERVYLAAGEFARGAPAGEVKLILENCSEFDEEDIKRILSRAISHRLDKDGGYRAFIRSVNNVVGDELYDERRLPAKPDSTNTSSQNTGASVTVTTTTLSGKNRRLLK